MYRRLERGRRIDELGEARGWTTKVEVDEDPIGDMVSLGTDG